MPLVLLELYFPLIIWTIWRLRYFHKIIDPIAQYNNLLVGVGTRVAYKGYARIASVRL